MRKSKPVFENASRAMPISPPDHKGRHQVPFTEERKERFLQALREGYSTTAAAVRAGCGLRTAYDHRDKDADFARLWQEAVEAGTDVFEDRMRELCFQPNGFLPTMATLKARRPSVWRDDQRITQGPVVNITINAPSPAELKAIIEGDFRLLPGTEGGSE